MSLKLFISKQCPSCISAREILNGQDYTVYDISTVDGLTEASFYGVLATPTLLMVDDQGEEIKRFVGKDIVEEVICI